MALDCIPVRLSRSYYILGRFVARHPLPFLIGPIILTCLCLLGLLRLNYTNDTEYLYSPTNGRAKDDRDFFQDTFPSNDNGFYAPERDTKFEGFLLVHIEYRRSKNILNTDAADAVFAINDFILSIQEKDDGVKYRYEDVCSNFNGVCTYSEIITILSNRMAGNYTDITYPNHVEPGFGTFNLVDQLGGVKLSGNVVTSARSILLTYVARTKYSDDRSKASKWMDKVKEKLDDYKDSRIKIEYQTAKSTEQELAASLFETLPLFAIASTCLGMFAVSSTMMFDHVRTKNNVAMAGMICSMLSSMSAVGLGSMCGLRLIAVVGNMPFLIIGIGLDNMFIMVSAWRYTSYKKSVEDRMGETMQSAAVSITITSVTDILAFGIGCFTPFRSITIFCVYAGVAVFFAYAYMLTFVSACMVYSGRREEANRHPLTCGKVLSQAEAEVVGKSKSYLLFCAGGSSENGMEKNQSTPSTNEPIKDGDEETNSQLEMDQIKTPTPATEHAQSDGVQLPFMNQFLGTTFAAFLMRPPVKAAVIAGYLVILGVAIYGIMNLEEGLDEKLLVPEDSYYRDYLKVYERDFVDINGPLVMVGVDKTLDYTQESVRNDIKVLMRKVRKTKRMFSDERYTISWLDTFDEFLNATGRDINNLTMTEFISILRDDFFPDPLYKRFSLDVAFGGNYTTVSQSRFYTQAQTVDKLYMKRELLSDVREIADDFKWEVEVFNPQFIFYDSYTVILSVTIQNLSIAVLCMMVVAFLLIPNITTVIWVTLSVMSICLCIVGYMSLWDVNLDTVSMINLVMCIGFSIDFAAHISYHFVISQSDEPTEKAKEALGYLGTPIIQGAGSTILGVSALAASTTYIYTTFFKIVFLVQVFGFFHGMFLLPVLLSTLDFSLLLKPCKKFRFKQNGASFDQTGHSNRAFENVV